MQAPIAESGEIISLRAFVLLFASTV